MSYVDVPKCLRRLSPKSPAGWSFDPDRSTNAREHKPTRKVFVLRSGCGSRFMTYGSRYYVRDTEITIDHLGSTVASMCVLAKLYVVDLLNCLTTFHVFPVSCNFKTAVRHTQAKGGNFMNYWLRIRLAHTQRHFLSRSKLHPFLSKAKAILGSHETGGVE